jgi:cyclic-di-GMP-binding protein
MISTLIEILHLPQQDLAGPTLFGADAESMTMWLAGLPKSNLGQTARAVHQAITELNRVALAPTLRAQLLEIIRPAIHYAGAGLRRHYLNQPIVLPEQAHKVARLAHVLHEQLAIGYTLVAIGAEIPGRQSGFGQAAFATSLHRGIAEHTLNLLRDYQLYRNPHAGCWRAIHQLAAVARSEGVDGIVVADQQSGNCTVQAAYLRALLLGSAKSTQLRQDDLAKIFQHAGGWAALVTLAQDEGNVLVLVDPNSDDGPIYRHFARPEANWLGLDTSQLARHLIEQAHCAEEAAFGEQPLSVELLAHLSHNWGTATTRAFQRMDVNEPIDVVLGLNTAHFLLAGEQELGALLGTAPAIETTLTLEDENPFLRPHMHGRAPQPAAKDVWDSTSSANARLASLPTDSIDTKVREEARKAQEKEREKYRLYAVERVNVSAGGLCIAWPANEPVQVRTGELVGLRESQGQAWSIGVIRWLRSTQGGPQLGVELLSPGAEAFGARVIHKTGPQGDYQRALLLPEVKQTGQPSTLLLPRLPFRAGQKVSLLCRDRETRVHLVRKIMSTPNFNLFEFRQLDSAPTEPETTSIAFDRGGAAAFENLWDNL